MNRYLAVVVLLAACGDDSSSTPIDAKTIDAMPDAYVLVDAPAPPPGHHHYVIDTILVPTNNNQAREYGQDLDNNAVIDNQLGMVLGTFASMGIDIQGTTTRQVDRGSSITLIDMLANDFGIDPAATFALFVGANPMPAACASTSDTTCRHHLAGTATFTIKTGAPTNPALTGAITTGIFRSAAGQLSVPLAVFPESTPVTVNLIGAKVVATQLSATKILSIKLGGGITNAEMDAKVYPSVRDGVAASVTKDCTAPTNPPQCGCTAGSQGKTWLDLFDGDLPASTKDCKVSIDEIKGSSLIQSLFAPDLLIGGQAALSVGFKATAVEAGFVAP